MTDSANTENGSAAEKRSVSASPDLFEKADEIARQRMMSSFSEYVRDLIRRDLKGELNHKAAPAAMHE